MRIVFLTPLYFDTLSNLGGGERLPTYLAKGVAAASPGEVSVELVSFGREAHRAAIHPGVEIRVLRAARVPRRPIDVVSWEIADALAGADLVHVHQVFTPAGELGVLAAKLHGTPLCATDHGGATSAVGLSLDMLDLADCVFCYSDFGATLLRTRARVEVIKGGVDAEFFTPEPRPRDRFLYVGRILPHKGIDRLIGALPADLSLTVCGSPQRADYLERLRQLAVGKRVEFVFDADDVALRALYRRSFATILPSVYEDCDGVLHAAPELMGLTLLESMACGTPAICSRVGGMPEFVAEGETGFVFDDVDVLAARLRQLATAPDLVEAMGRRGRERAEREYDLRVVGARMLAVYRSLVRARAERAACG